MVVKAISTPLFAWLLLFPLPGSAEPIDADDVYIACSSSVGPSYSGHGRRIDWSTYVAIADLKKAGFKLDTEYDESVTARFLKWMRATNQIGRWNSVWEEMIDCSPVDGGYPQRRPGRDPEIADWRDARLPKDWYRRDPSDPQEIARYSTGQPAPGSSVSSAGSLNIAPTSPPIEPGWDDKVRAARQKESADIARLAARSARLQAESDAAFARYVADMRRRGSAQ